MELETDKVNTELAAEEAGVLASILHREGETVRPGDTLGTINAQAEAAVAPAANGASPAAESTPAAAADEPHAPNPTPLAQRVAEDLQVDVSRVPASGPGGRVTRQDVESFARQGATETSAPAPASTPAAQPTAPPQASPAAAAQPSGRPETRQRLSRRRITIARRLVEAQHTAAMLTTFNESDLTAVMDLRKRRKDAFKEQHGVNLGFMSFFTKASIGALKVFPQVNAELQGEELVLKQYYDIGIAIGDPEGLGVPILRDADKMTFAQIEQAIAGYAKKAKDRALTPADLSGGTFTITNGGVFGSLLSTPILNPPQVAILGMHKIQERPVAMNGQVVIRPMMYVALTYDHRIVDGREAVQFLVRIKEFLEDPESLLLAS